MIYSEIKFFETCFFPIHMGVQRDVAFQHGYADPANKRYCPNAVLMLAHSL